ncbi:MAG: hypothetical protein JWM10_2976, partial [Myxococcaceae bacterium]|nr:hypothetical protein [Myxococcaceae bacterium]
MARLHRSLAFLGLALAGCDDAPATPADAAVVDLDVAASDLGAFDRPAGDAPAADVPTVTLDGGAVVRSCRTAFALNVGRPARSVSVAGEWNSFSTTANPLTPVGSTGVFRGELDLPAGDYGYKFVVDGDQYLADPEVV